MKNLPENDDEYYKLLGRIVKGAEYVENPLITDEDKEKGIKLYETLVQTARAYRERERV